MDDKKRKYILRIGIMILIFLVGTVLDQGTKAWARENLSLGVLYSNTLDTMFIQLAYNEGAFFGFGGDLSSPFREIFLWILPALFLIGFGIYLFSPNKTSLFENLSFTFILTGGIGNVWDRFTQGGKVTDFLYFEIPGLGWRFTGVVNLADIYITFAVIALLGLYLYQNSQKKKAAKAKVKS